MAAGGPALCVGDASHADRVQSLPLLASCGQVLGESRRWRPADRHCASVTRLMLIVSSRFRSWLPFNAARWTRLGGARALERATAASGGRMPKRSGRAAIGGPDGRRERPASGHGHPRAGDFHPDVGVPSSRRRAHRLATTAGHQVQRYQARGVVHSARVRSDAVAPAWLAPPSTSSSRPRGCL